MAVTKLGNTKSAANSIGYFDSRAEFKSGINCDPDSAKEQFKATREIWSKTDGVQAHTIIQSFKPGEFDQNDAWFANELGRELAEEIAGDYEVAIYTHVDKDHIHNHIIINAVHPETGLKYQSDREALNAVKDTNDYICRSHGFSVPNKPAKVRYTQTEQALLEKGKDSWKDEIRQAIDQTIKKSSNYEDFKGNLKNDYEIDTKDSGKHIVFTHPDNGKKSRGHKLGESYTKEGIQRGIERQIENRSPERSKEDSRGRKPRVDNGLDRSGGMERGVSKLPELNKNIRELTPTGRREAETAQRAAEETVRLLERQQQATFRKANHRSFDHER